MLAPAGVFVALCRALWCLFGTLGGLGAPSWHLEFLFAHTWGIGGSLLGTSGRPWDFYFGTLGLHLGTLGVHVGVLWALWGVALDPSGHFFGKGSKKGTQNGRPN